MATSEKNNGIINQPVPLRTASEKINDIINQRIPLGEKVAKVIQNINSIRYQLRNLDKYRQQFIQKIGDSQGIKKLQEINLTSLQESLKNELKTLNKLSARFSRQTLNIAVVGRAGQGKSTLLQKLTGLSTAEIPDGGLDHCTGVRSTIHHQPGVETHGEVYFHNENSFLEEVIKPYYEKLNLGEVPTTLNEFAQAPLPQLLDDSSEAQLMYTHLQKYYDNFNNYGSLLTQQSPLDINKEQIREYVAQDNLQGERVYYNYLAVKEVKIFCNFLDNCEVEKIALIDQPGLGDTGVGNEERLMKVVGEDVDVVIFVKMPARGKRGWEDVDIKLYDTVRQSLSELPLKQWSYMVLNRLNDNSNLELCNYHQREIGNNNIEVVQTIIANCHDPVEAKNQVLDPILDELLFNITYLDKQYASSCQQRLLQIQKQIQTELKKAYSAIPTNQDKTLFKKLFNKLWSDLTNSLEELLQQVRLNRHQEDERFKEQVESILGDCHSDNRLPASVQEIEQIKREFGTYTDAYCHYLPLIRTHLSLQLLSLDGKMQESIEQIKEVIAEKLTKVGLGGVSISRGSDFLSSLTSQLPEGLTHLSSGFKNIAQYNVSYAGIIQNRLRPHLDLLSPDKTPLVFSESLMYEQLVENLSQIAPQKMTEIAQRSFSYEELQNLIRLEIKEKNILLTLEQEKALFLPNPTNSDIDSELLSQQLNRIYTKVLIECEESLQKLLQEPNQIIYSMTANFVDVVLRADQVRDEWEIFLEDEGIQTQVWAEFKQIETLKQQRSKWLEQLDIAMEGSQVNCLTFV